VARKKASARKATPLADRHAKSWACLGLDVSMTSISVACEAYDSVLDKLLGPVTKSVRWERNVHYYERMVAASKAHNLILDAVTETGVVQMAADKVFIGIEEPWPMGIVKRAASGWLKQQAQIQGAVLGSLLRYGWQNIYEVNNQAWKNIVRADLEKKGIDKFDVKTWALALYEGLPDLPDLIESSKGLIPRPAKSKAKAKQPDDIYDAVAIMSWLEAERGV
jgi:hypothetical protein